MIKTNDERITKKIMEKKREWKNKEAKQRKNTRNKRN